MRTRDGKGWGRWAETRCGHALALCDEPLRLSWLETYFHRDGSRLNLKAVSADQVPLPSSKPTSDRSPTRESLDADVERGRAHSPDTLAETVVALARLRVAQLQGLTVSLAKTTAVDEVLAIAVRDISATFGARVTIVARVVVNGTELEVVAGADPRELSASHDDFPLDVGRGRVTGIVSVLPNEPRALDDDDRALATAMATECAVAIERTFLVDVVRRAQIEAEAARLAAEDAHRSRRDFLAVMSHELRTPLNAIAGYAELIEIGVHGPINAQQLDAVQRLQRSQRHLLGLINGMLNYARVEAGSVNYEMTPVPLDDIVTECVALVAQQAQSKQQYVRSVGGMDRIRVVGDRERIEQVLLNLLSNAVKFTDVGGAITVSFRIDGDLATIDVADTGRGLAANQLERVFEPFVQVDARLTRSHGGVGLGLSISRGLARGMGGDITVESVLGVGSTFRFALPIHVPSCAPDA
jgi:signal transduction histidine kinase